MTNSAVIEIPLTRLRECQSEQCEMPGHTAMEEGKVIVCPDCKHRVVRCFNCWAQEWTHACTDCTGGRGVPAGRTLGVYREGEEWDADANGWLSNARKWLEE